MKTIIPFLSLVLVAGIVFAERQPYSRYQSIVDRQMFGEPPDGFDPTKPPSEAVTSRAAQKAEQQLSKEQEKLKSAIHFSMINVTPSGETAVGFTDSGSKPPINYYLKVGESRGGWLVKEADAGKGTMTIVKGEIEVSLTIGGNSANGAGTTSAAGSTTPATTTPAVRGGLTALRAQRRSERNEQKAQTAKMAEMLQAMKDREAADAKRREEDSLRREEENAAHEAERAEQRAQLQELKDQLTREREERKKSETSEQKTDGEGSGSEQSDSGDSASPNP